LKIHSSFSKFPKNQVHYWLLLIAYSIRNSVSNVFGESFVGFAAEATVLVVAVVAVVAQFREIASHCFSKLGFY